MHLPAAFSTWSKNRWCHHPRTEKVLRAAKPPLLTSRGGRMGHIRKTKETVAPGCMSPFFHSLDLRTKKKLSWWEFQLFSDVRERSLLQPLTNTVPSVYPWTKIKISRHGQYCEMYSSYIKPNTECAMWWAVLVRVDSCTRHETFLW